MKGFVENILVPIPALFLFVFLMYCIQFLGYFHRKEGG